MSKADLNAERVERRAHWRQRAATWKLRSTATDRLRDERLNRLLLDAAGVCPAAVVLDLGAGSGEPAISAALRAGANGRVVALDHAPEMLAGARERAVATSREQIQCVVGDMVELPFADATFDAVVGRFSLMSVPDRRAVLGEARRSLRPGGRAAFLVWGPEAANDRLRTLREGMTGFFGADAVAPDNRTGLGEAGALAGLFRAAGFTDMAEQAVADIMEVSTDRDVWSSRMERHYGDLIKGLTESERTALDAALRSAYEPYRHGNVYRMHAELRLGFAAAPFPETPQAG